MEPTMPSYKTIFLVAPLLSSCFDFGKAPPLEFCGDSLTNGVEECDDGNLVNGDGCSSVCLKELIECDVADISKDALAFCNSLLAEQVDPEDCQDTGPTPVDFCNVSFRQEVMPIMTNPQTCGADGNCHGNDPAPQNFRVDPEDVALTLQNLLADATGPKVKPPFQRIVPFAPEDSYLLHKISLDREEIEALGGVGVRMPFLGRRLCPDDIATICFWAAEGAEDDP
jgi:cysteine-rich repeat protein